MRHRRGTPGLTPYRLRTIEAGYPRRRRPARHLRRPATKPSNKPTNKATSIARRKPDRVTRRGAGSQVAMGIAGLVALALLVVGGYQAAAGAAVVLGMF
jgi:hypothetical protein